MAKRTCSVDGCENTGRLIRGWCKKHYTRWLRHGDPEVAQPCRPWPTNLTERMEPQENGCIHFTGHINRYGYGSLSREDVTVGAHRAAYEHFVGPIPEGMTLDHECHNRSGCTLTDATCPHRRCVNVEHLVPKLMGDNVLASPNTITGINARKTHCPRGHEYNGQNTGRGTRGERYCLVCHRDKERQARAEGRR